MQKESLTDARSLGPSLTHLAHLDAKSVLILVAPPQISLRTINGSGMRLPHSAHASEAEEVGSDHVYVNKRMMSRIANNIPLRRI